MEMNYDLYEWTDFMLLFRLRRELTPDARDTSPDPASDISLDNFSFRPCGPGRAPYSRGIYVPKVKPAY